MYDSENPLTKEQVQQCKKLIKQQKPKQYPKYDLWYCNERIRTGISFALAIIIIKSKTGQQKLIKTYKNGNLAYNNFELIPQ